MWSTSGDPAAQLIESIKRELKKFDRFDDWSLFFFFFPGFVFCSQLFENHLTIIMIIMIFYLDILVVPRNRLKDFFRILKSLLGCCEILSRILWRASCSYCLCFLFLSFIFFHFLSKYLLKQSENALAMISGFVQDSFSFFFFGIWCFEMIRRLISDSSSLSPRFGLLFLELCQDSLGFLEIVPMDSVQSALDSHRNLPRIRWDSFKIDEHFEQNKNNKKKITTEKNILIYICVWILFFYSSKFIFGILLESLTILWGFLEDSLKILWNWF